MPAASIVENNNATTPPESSLIPPIRDFGVDYFFRRSQDMTVNSETEISAGFGIADIVFFQFNEEIVADRRKRQLQPIPSEEIIKTLFLIRNRKRISLTYLANTLPFGEKQLKFRVLRFLEEKGLISKIDTDNYTINYRYVIGLNRSVAIEAKVKDWKRGLYQAYRYKWFADASYLALYKSYVEQPKNNIQLFKKLNVGLLSVSESQVEEVIYRPVRERPQSRYMKAVAFERLLARVY